MKRLLGFPEHVNETSARVVATGVVLLGVLFLASGSGWVLLVLAYGFLARVLSGPTLSPLGQLATRLVTPRLPGHHRLVAGAPKKFAQAIGLAFSVGAGMAWLLGAPALSYVLIVGLIGAAGLESAFSLCLGCVVYDRIWGCADCADLADRLAHPEQAPAVALGE